MTTERFSGSSVDGESGFHRCVVARRHRRGHHAVAERSRLLTRRSWKETRARPSSASPLIGGLLGYDGSGGLLPLPARQKRVDDVQVEVASGGVEPGGAQDAE